MTFCQCFLCLVLYCVRYIWTLCRLPRWRWTSLEVQGEVVDAGEGKLSGKFHMVQYKPWNQFVMITWMTSFECCHVFYYSSDRHRLDCTVQTACWENYQWRGKVFLKVVTCILLIHWASTPPWMKVILRYDCCSRNSLWTGFVFNHIYEPFAGCSHEINCHEYVNDKFYNCHDLIIPLTGIDWSAVESACGKTYQWQGKVFP